jgi:glycerol-3-phosphate dehydrogenase
MLLTLILGVESYLLTRAPKRRQATRPLSRSIGDENESFEDIHFAILGGGAFSLALARVLSYKNISCSLLVRGQAVADHINRFRHHPKYLSESVLPAQLWATADPASALRNPDYVVHAVPMQESRKFLESMKPFLPQDAPILSVTKGVELSTFSLMSDIIAETLGPSRRAAFLSGPSFAKEIMNGEATAVVIASADDVLSKELSLILSSVAFRCHTSRDVKVPLLSFILFSIFEIFLIFSTLLITIITFIIQSREWNWVEL